MKKILLSLFAAAIFISAAAQSKTTYPLLISFNSVCCGVPSDVPVIKFISSFKKQNKIKTISADHIGPMGREGEYYLAFRLKELSKKQKAKFIDQLKKIVPTMKGKGSAHIRENEDVDTAALGRASIITNKL